MPSLLRPPAAADPYIANPIASPAIPENWANMHSLSSPIIDETTGRLSIPWNQFLVWVTSRASFIGNMQGDLTTAQGNIITLQSNVTTLQGQVSTLQGQVSSLEGRM